MNTWRIKNGVGDRVRVDEKGDVCLMYDVLKPTGNTYTCIEFCIIYINVTFICRFIKIIMLSGNSQHNSRFCRAGLFVTGY